MGQHYKSRNGRIPTAPGLLAGKDKNIKGGGGDMKKKFVIASILLSLVLALSLVGCMPEGEQGKQGERGKRGYEGDEGDRGPRGHAGGRGATGATGGKGDTGDTGPAFSGLGVLLYVEDGTQEISHVTYVLDEPIALGDLTELMFFQELVYGTGNFGANVILGIDVDGDGYEANDLAWHIGTTQHTLAVLGDDTFISMDGAPSGIVKVDAMSISQWWTPDESGAGFAKSDLYPWTFYGSFSDFINVFLPDSNQTSLIPDASAEVCLIRLVIGGSGSWNDFAIRVTSDMIPSEVGVYP